MSETTGGTPPPTDAFRRAELLAGAAFDDLDAAERAELDAMAAADPEVAAELAELREVVAVLPPAGSGWDDVAPSADLDSRIAALGGGAADDGTDDAPTPPVAPATPVLPQDDLSRRRVAREQRRGGGLGRRLGAVAASVALVAVGASAGIGVDRWQDRPTTGPPGTLGALEQVAVTVPDGVTADVDVVAHTWGTESLMTVSGLEVGGAYTLVLVDEAGAEVQSGTLLGTEIPVVCRMNAAVLRPDAAVLELRDSTGAAVVTADLPPAAVASAQG